jgi:hypothetical protein
MHQPVRRYKSSFYSLPIVTAAFEKSGLKSSFLPSAGRLWLPWQISPPAGKQLPAEQWLIAEQRPEQLPGQDFGGLPILLLKAIFSQCQQSASR